MTQTADPDFVSLLLIFGLAPGASLDEVKERKHFKTRVTHPDVVPADLRDKANEELAKMNAAWDELNAWFTAHPEETNTPKQVSEAASAEERPPGEAPKDRRQSEDECPDFEDWVKNQGNAWGVDVSLDIEQLERQRRQKLAVSARRDLVVKAKFAVGILLAIAFVSTCFGGINQPARDAWLENWKQQAEYAVRHGDGTAYFNPQATAAKYKLMADEQKRKWAEEDANRRPGQLLVIAAIAAFLAVQFHAPLKKKTENWIESAPAE